MPQISKAKILCVDENDRTTVYRNVQSFVQDLKLLDMVKVMDTYRELMTCSGTVGLLDADSATPHMFEDKAVHEASAVDAEARQAAVREAALAAFNDII